MNSPASSRPAPSLTTPRIIFLVAAAAAPIAAVVGLSPLQFALGNGAGTPVAFVVAGAVLLCFGVGYAAMARRITNTGGFYTFITRGLGRHAGVSGAMVAIIAYLAVGLQLAGGFGYFVSYALQQISGTHTPWYLWTALGTIGAGTLSYRSVALSAKVLGLLMLLELGVLFVLSAFIVGHRGGQAFPTETFHPGVAFGAGFAISILIAFSTFIGFESAALYGEESRNPSQTIPRAIYGSLILITVVYATTTWIGIGAVGADHLKEVTRGLIAKENLGSYYFNIATSFIGQGYAAAMLVLICTSIFASLLAIQNASSRYLYSLGRERLLPRALGRLDDSSGAPAQATLVVTAVNLFVPSAFFLTHQDVYLTLVGSMTGLGAVGIIALQALAATSVIGYFWRRPDRHTWKTVIAPALGFVGLLAAESLVISHFSLLTGTDSSVINRLPVLYGFALAGGLVYAVWLSKRRAHIFADLASDALRRAG